MLPVNTLRVRNTDLSAVSSPQLKVATVRNQFRLFYIWFHSSWFCGTRSLFCLLFGLSQLASWEM